MKPEIKAKWLDALRSGAYPKGIGALQEDGEYCCLGVLCELAVEDGVIPAPTPGDVEGLKVYDGMSAFLPSSVQGWAGLDNDSGRYDLDAPDTYHSLVILNDDSDTFEPVIKAIEERF